VCAHGLPSGARAPRIPTCFLFPYCDIHAPEWPVLFPHRLLYAASASGGWVMTFEEILDQAIAMLQRRGRLTYRTLQLHFHLDDEHLEALKDELIYGQRLAVDEDDRVLVWTGDTGAAPPATPARAGTPARTPLSYTPPYLAEKIF